uniref:Uncharacterized protein n=1 Tax=Desertifilum tharense IPPAS B-1220 TaxID=1781255 RepID=A0ACD5H3A5_9CYAN
MNSTKRAGAIAIAANRFTNSSQSFSIPNSWQLPKFRIGDRVQYMDRHCLMVCVIRGMEYFPNQPPNYLTLAGKKGLVLLPTPGC